jgi:hypothetical protein
LYFPSFVDYVDKLGELIEQEKIDTITWVLQELRHNNDFLSLGNVSPKLLSDSYYCLTNRINQTNYSLSDFKLLVKEFENILCIYHKVCIQDPLERAIVIGREKIPETTKENYQRALRLYEVFITNYTDFSKRGNNDFGLKIFRDYFYLPPQL